MKRQICGEDCKGNLIVKDACIEGELRACGDCLNDFGNQNYNNLIKRIEGKNRKINIQKMAKKNNSIR